VTPAIIHKADPNIMPKSSNALINAAAWKPIPLDASFVDS
jgi:hypothetical protein